MQDGDVIQTYADLSKISKYVNFQPKTDIETGISIFCDWYKNYHNIL